MLLPPMEPKQTTPQEEPNQPTQQEGQPENTVPTGDVKFQETLMRMIMEMREESKSINKNTASTNKNTESTKEELKKDSQSRID